ncbi:MAG: N-acetyltransferase [Thaumarchaeota archaeon]|nr:N-acetyltransferase [Nitrososphaerota archaeon]
MCGFVSEKAVVRGAVLRPSIILGKSIIGDGTIIDQLVCIGYPKREKLRKLPRKLEELDDLSSGARIGSKCIIRSQSIIYEEVEVGDNVEMGHGVMVREGSKIAANSKIGSFTQLDGSVMIGASVNIQSGVYLPHLTIVEDGVFIGPRAIVTNDPYPVSGRLLGVRIRKGAVIGAGAILIAGIEVGEGAVIAAGAIVTKDVPANQVVVGAPARLKMSREDYEKKKKAHEES